MKPFVIDGHDNDLYFFKGRADVQRCERCGALTQKWAERLPEDAASKVAADVSCSYDGVLVVSERFKDIYERAGLRGLDFRRVGAARWAITAERVVAFDAEKRKTRFEGACPVCGKFESVTGATPAFLTENAVVQPAEFVRTDVEFGDGDEQHPLLICGAEAAAVLRRGRLSGLELQEVANA